MTAPSPMGGLPTPPDAEDPLLAEYASKIRWQKQQKLAVDKWRADRRSTADAVSRLCHMIADWHNEIAGLAAAAEKNWSLDPVSGWDKSMLEPDAHFINNLVSQLCDVGNQFKHSGEAAFINNIHRDQEPGFEQARLLIRDAIENDPSGVRRRIAGLFALAQVDGIGAVDRVLSFSMYHPNGVLEALDRALQESRNAEVNGVGAVESRGTQELHSRDWVSAVDTLRDAIQSVKFYLAAKRTDRHRRMNPRPMDWPDAAVVAASRVPRPDTDKKISKVGMVSEDWLSQLLGDLQEANRIDPNDNQAIIDLIRRLDSHEKVLWPLRQQDAPSDSNFQHAGAATKPLVTAKRKRSTERGEGQIRLIAALTKHHQYSGSSCLTQEPVGNNELAELAGVSISTASAFFKRKFGGHSKYRADCRNVASLIVALKLLNQEFAPRDILGRNSPSETIDDN